MATTVEPFYLRYDHVECQDLASATQAMAEGRPAVGLVNITMDMAVMETFCKSLKQNPGLLELGFRGCIFDAPLWAALAKGLTHTPNIRVLDLCQNVIGADGSPELASVLECLPHLTKLLLRHTELTDDGVPHLLRAFQRTPRLQWLELGGNGLQDKGVAMLAEGLVCAPSLGILFIEENLYSNNGIESLARLLSKNRSLFVLDFGSDVQERSLLPIDKEAFLQQSTYISHTLEENRLLGESMIRAARLGDWPRVRECLEAGVSPMFGILRPQWFGWRDGLFETLVIWNHPEILRSALQWYRDHEHTRRLDPAHFLTSRHETVMELALRLSHTECIQVLQGVWYTPGQVESDHKVKDYESTLVAKQDSHHCSSSAVVVTKAKNDVTTISQVHPATTTLKALLCRLGDRLKNMPLFLRRALERGNPLTAHVRTYLWQYLKKVLQTPEATPEWKEKEKQFYRDTLDRAIDLIQKHQRIDCELVLSLLKSCPVLPKVSWGWSSDDIQSTFEIDFTKCDIDGKPEVRPTPPRVTTLRQVLARLDHETFPIVWQSYTGRNFREVLVPGSVTLCKYEEVPELRCLLVVGKDGDSGFLLAECLYPHPMEFTLCEWAANHPLPERYEKFLQFMEGRHGKVFSASEIAYIPSHPTTLYYCTLPCDTTDPYEYLKGFQFVSPEPPPPPPPPPPSNRRDSTEFTEALGNPREETFSSLTLQYQYSSSPSSSFGEDQGESIIAQMISKLESQGIETVEKVYDFHWYTPGKRSFCYFVSGPFQWRWTLIVRPTTVVVRMEPGCIFALYCSPAFYHKIWRDHIHGNLCSIFHKEDLVFDLIEMNFMSAESNIISYEIPPGKVQLRYWHDVVNLWGVMNSTIVHCLTTYDHESTSPSKQTMTTTTTTTTYVMPKDKKTKKEKRPKEYRHE